MRALLISICLMMSSSVALAGPDDGFDAMLKTLGDAFTKGDAKAAAALFVEDGELYTPTGVFAHGRKAVEAAISRDLTTLLKGATSKFTVDKLRDLGGGTYLLDANHEAANMTGPDGKPMTGKLHVFFVVTKGKDGKLLFVTARPYMFLPSPVAKPTPPVPGPKKM